MKYKIFSLLIVALVFVSCEGNPYQDKWALAPGGPCSIYDDRGPCVVSGRIRVSLSGDRNNGRYASRENNTTIAVEWLTDANGRVTTSVSVQAHFSVPHTVHFQAREAFHCPINHSIRVTVIGEFRTNSGAIGTPTHGQHQSTPFRHNFTFNIDELFKRP